MNLRIVDPFYKVVTLYLYDLISYATFLRHAHFDIRCVTSHSLCCPIEMPFTFGNYAIQGANVADTACD